MGFFCCTKYNIGRQCVTHYVLIVIIAGMASIGCLTDCWATPRRPLPNTTGLVQYNEGLWRQCYTLNNQYRCNNLAVPGLICKFIINANWLYWEQIMVKGKVMSKPKTNPNYTNDIKIGYVEAVLII